MARSPSAPGSFRCVRCGLDVPLAAPGTAHRNHCPTCLWSRHVDDDVPGDRASDCRASMEPIAIHVRGDGEWVLVHRCTDCGVGAPQPHGRGRQPARPRPHRRPAPRPSSVPDGAPARPPLDRIGAGPSRLPVRMDQVRARRTAAIGVVGGDAEAGRLGGEGGCGGDEQAPAFALGRGGRGGAVDHDGPVAAAGDDEAVALELGVGPRRRCRARGRDRAASWRIGGN